MSTSGTVLAKYKTTGLRIACAAVSVSILALSAACTTVEGGNAFVDTETFSREVIDSTVIGLGLKERVYKEVPKNQNAPLVLPQAGTVSAPGEGRIAELPEDSDGVVIDPNKVSPEMVRRIRKARVVDSINVTTGRPLTPQEIKLISERIGAARLKFQKNRQFSLFEPPSGYFTSRGGSDLVCLAPDGDLVLLDDVKCPPEIRLALEKIAEEEKARERLIAKQFDDKN